jgi:hypothetical protein
MRKKTYDVLKKYETIFAEPFPDICEYFEKLENDEKPSINLEIYSKPLARIRSLKNALEKLGFYVYKSKHHHLSVSKIPSIGYWLCQVDNDGFGYNAGAVGVLLGIPLKEVYEYVKRTGEERFLLKKRRRRNE